MSEILFHSEDIVFQVRKSDQIKSWITEIIELEGKTTGFLNYIFCTDSYLHKINTEYLKKDLYTDILTFDNSEDESIIEGDIFISIERVRENAARHNKSFQNELSRVMIHGVLHLLEFDDKSKAEKLQMRKKEEACLSLLKK